MNKILSTLYNALTFVAYKYKGCNHVIMRTIVMATTLFIQGIQPVIAQSGAGQEKAAFNQQSTDGQQAGRQTKPIEINDFISRVKDIASRADAGLDYNSPEILSVSIVFQPKYSRTDLSIDLSVKDKTDNTIIAFGSVGVAKTKDGKQNISVMPGTGMPDMSKPEETQKFYEKQSKMMQQMDPNGPFIDTREKIRPYMEALGNEITTQMSGLSVTFPNTAPNPQQPKVLNDLQAACDKISNELQMTGISFDKVNKTDFVTYTVDGPIPSGSIFVQSKNVATEIHYMNGQIDKIKTTSNSSDNQENRYNATDFTSLDNLVGLNNTLVKMVTNGELKVNMPPIQPDSPVPIKILPSPQI